MRIKKILIANRGEIAVRVIKTCREMGINSVAVYSDIDKDAMHVRMADEAHCIGPAPARESYLNQKKIIEVAKKTKADAIHPGYGFLSENPKFVELLEENGIIFIGPNSKSIRLLGDKTAARTLAKSINVPIVPGTTESIKTYDEAVETARYINYPILLKAAGGGGGKGMRIVYSEAELASALKGSQSEALSAFGDDRIYIEKYIENPRHIEVQILADSHGNIIHLGERECSIQRRHQKIIEESPSTIVTPEIRERLVKSAIQTKKVRKPLPIILYGRKYWNEIINFDSMVKYRTISPTDLKLIEYADTPEEAFEYLKKKLKNHYKKTCKREG
jgi:acetyl/propionyl-CoA carboxylase alpha subunit